MAVGANHSEADRPGWRHARSRSRLIVMVAVGVVSGVLTALLGSITYAPIVAWDSAALVFCVWVWLAIGTMNATVTKAHATRDDPGRATSDLIIILAAMTSLAAVGVVLVQASSAKGVTEGLLAGLGVFSVALSWAAVHTLFTLRYAMLYYTGADGGIDFNQKSAATYGDFAYFGFTIGMTYQVSDTTITKPAIRAAVLRHALLSYLLGAVVLASAINLVVSLGSQG